MMIEREIDTRMMSDVLFLSQGGGLRGVAE
jgi:hypothetical protein